MEHAIQEHHGLLPLLSSMLLFFALAGLIVPFLKRLGISQILGYLICGLIIGPHGLAQLSSEYNWLSPFVISDTHLVTSLGELGIVALMFMIGLELSFKRLNELKVYVLGLGSLQIIITAIVIFLVALMFDNSLKTSILVGTSLALSSTAIIMHLLNETHRINRPVGKIAFSVLLMQDLAVVPILVLLSAFSGSNDSNIVIVLFEALFTAVIAIIAIYLIGKLILRPILNYLSLANHPEWLTAITLFLLMAGAALTESFGLSAALGAFLVGLLIAETEYKHEIEVIIEPVKSMLLGIFFLSIGMMINIHAILDEPFWLFASVIGVFFIKTIIVFPLCLMFKIPKARSIEVSITLAQCGEFAFLILSMALIQGLIVEKDAQFFLLVAALSMLITPFTTKLGGTARKIVCRVLKTTDAESKFEKELEAEERHAIIAGFGRVGKTLGAILEKQMIPYVAIDKNIELVEETRKKGYRIIYGNAKRKALLRRLNVMNATALIITLDNYEDTIKILKDVRKSYPILPIIVRTRDTSKMEELYDNGANHVIPETLESSLQLAGHVLETLGMSHTEMIDLIDQKRKQSILEHLDIC